MIGWLLQKLARRRIRAIARQGRDPERLQCDTLLHLVQTAARTRFGKAHEFAAIDSVAAFRERVPLGDYESHQPYFERAQNYSVDETWPGTPACFAMTSGTTGGNKYLPHTEPSIRASMAGGTDALWAYLVRTNDRSLLRGKIAFLGGSVALDAFPSGMPWGDNTGILAARSPRWVRPFRAPSAATLALGDWEKKLAVAAKELEQTDVRLLLGVPSWALLLLDAVEAINGRTIRDIWPSWRGFIHGGMAFGPYAKTFRRRVGDGVEFVDTYTATEGGMLAIQDRRDDPSMAVILDRGVYYEFIGPDERRCGIHEVEVEVPYRIAVTTNAGLWAYEIGDLVRFTSVAPPRLVFHGRRRFFLNAFGEHVSQGELERAIENAAFRTACEVAEFTVMPEYPDAQESSGRHQFLVEFLGAPPDLTEFAQAIDATIAAGNEDYATHRGSAGQLRPPVVRLIRSGTFVAWMKSRGRLGGQNKVPRIVDAELARGLLPGT